VPRGASGATGAEARGRAELPGSSPRPPRRSAEHLPRAVFAAGVGAVGHRRGDHAVVERCTPRDTACTGCALVHAEMHRQGRQVPRGPVPRLTHTVGLRGVTRAMRPRTGLNGSSPRGPASAGSKPARSPRSASPATATTTRRRGAHSLSKAELARDRGPWRASTTRRSPPRSSSTAFNHDVWTARSACCHRPSSGSSFTDATPRRPPSSRQFRAVTEPVTRQVWTGSPGLLPRSAKPASEPR
jgi:hypothetical protein